MTERIKRGWHLYLYLLTINDHFFCITFDSAVLGFVFWP